MCAASVRILAANAHLACLTAYRYGRTKFRKHPFVQQAVVAVHRHLKHNPLFRKLLPVAGRLAQSLPVRVMAAALGLYAAVSFSAMLLLPHALFDSPGSTAVYAADGSLLGARIADDHQWRFHVSDDIPLRYKSALLEYEDSRFYLHPGIDPAAVIRAARDNAASGTIVSGASTISMQVVRLLRRSVDRTWKQKMIEAYLTLGLELRFTKEGILKLYASHAPFGGNVVGLHAASWRYFGRSPDELSWAESAMLAVLPNSPALIHPGRNRDELKAKRDSLLFRLHEAGKLDEIEYTLALAEELPEAPHPLPRLAPRLVDTLAARHPGTHEFHTTIDQQTQAFVNTVVANRHSLLARSGIYNVCAIVIDNSTSEVIAYTGNSPEHADRRVGSRLPETGYDIDIIRRPRSTGSILKPLLFAAMLDDGFITPDTLVLDVPLNFGGYMPENFSRTYRGALPARDALSMSLNVPAVVMLQEYGYQRFYRMLKSCGITTINRPADHYGLSLILGGAEGTLWEIASLYSSIARIASGKSIGHPAVLAQKKGTPAISGNISAGAAYLTLEALLGVERPGLEGYWKSFAGSQKIAWKTGTSLGHRDAWAVGVTPRYTVGVWCGNADGEGRPGMTGLAVAAPVLFEIFGGLKRSGWFTVPYEKLKTVGVCADSGLLPNRHCDISYIQIPKDSHFDRQCTYHRLIHTDPDGRYRVTDRCMQVSQMRHTRWFVLPPVAEYYYVKHNPSYKKLPPIQSGCVKDGGDPVKRLSLIYPSHNASVYVPVDITGEKSAVIMRAAHADESAVIYWHIDDTYLGSTRTFHEMALQPDAGTHVLTLVDDAGNSIEKRFTVLDTQ